MGLTLLRVKSLEKLLEVPLGVMRPGRGLGVVLDSKNGVFLVSDAFHGAVIEVTVRDFEPFCARNVTSFAPDREPVVLRRDKHLTRLEIPNWVIAAAVAVWEFHGFPTVSEPQELVTETDPEDRDRPIGQVADRLHSVGHRRRVAGTVTEKHAVGIQLPHPRGRCRGRDDGDAAALLHE